MTLSSTAAGTLASAACAGAAADLVLTDYMDAAPDHGNLACIHNDGSEVWRVTPATYSHDAWTVARLEGDADVTKCPSGSIR